MRKQMEIGSAAKIVWVINHLCEAGGGSGSGSGGVVVQKWRKLCEAGSGGGGSGSGGVVVVVVESGGSCVRRMAAAAAAAAAVAAAGLGVTAVSKSGGFFIGVGNEITCLLKISKKIL